MPKKLSETEKLLKNIKSNLDQNRISKTDEVSIMQTMLNDFDYSVDVYNNVEKIGTYCPAEDARKLAVNIVQSSTKISKAEAVVLVNEYKYGKQEAESMINLGKEFINTYLDCGRPIKLGGRSMCNPTLIADDKKPGLGKPVPSISGIDEKGNPIYTKKYNENPAYRRISCSSPCPSYLR